MNTTMTSIKRNSSASIFTLTLVALGTMLAFNSSVAAPTSPQDEESVIWGKDAKSTAKNKLDNNKDPQAVAIGFSAKAGESATAVGREANASGVWATAMGAKATAKGNFSIASGHGSKADGKQAIAVGKDSKAQGDFAVAVGDGTVANKLSSAFGKDAKAEGEYSTAFGWKSNAKGSISTALGWSAQASGERAQAIGPQAKASGKRALSFGSGTNTTAENGVSIGSQTNNYAMGAVSMGHNNIIQASSENAVVIGNNIHNTAKNSVFLGDSSAYTAPSETTGGIGKVEGNYAGVDAKGVVSVGSKDNERRIQNVAAGLLSKNSTDAVNGSQLHATNERVEAINKDAKAGIAAAMAFQALPFVPGKWSYSAGTARYSSEQAVALSFGRTAASGRWAVSGGMSTDSRGRVGVRLGVSGVFN